MNALRPKYLVTAQLWNSPQGDPIDFCEIWDSSQPLPIGHPFKWVLEKTQAGVRIRNIASPLQEASQVSFREISKQSIDKGMPIALPEPESKSKRWIKIQPLQDLAPAFESQGKISEKSVLKAYQCVGPFIQDVRSLEDRYEGVVHGKTLFVAKKSGKGYTFDLKADGLEIHIPGNTKTKPTGKFETTEIDGLSIEFGSIRWLFSRTQLQKLTTANTKKTLDADSILFQKFLSRALTAFLVLIGIMLFTPKPDQKIEETTLIPPQYTSIVMQKLKPKSEEPAPAAGAASELEAPAQKATETKVVQAFRSKALQSSVSGLLKGGMTKLLAQSSLVTASQNANKVFGSTTNKDLRSSSALSGVENTKTVEVAKLGGTSAGGSVGYGEGKRVGVNGQGSSFVDLDIGGSIVQQGLTKEEVGRVIHSHMSEIRYCYESSMIRNPDLEGKLVVDFVIGGNGFVKTSNVKQSTLEDPKLDDCLLRRLAKWKFPNPKGGVDVAVTYPFIFKSIGR